MRLRLFKSESSNELNHLSSYELISCQGAHFRSHWTSPAKLTDNLNFLGVQLAKNASTTRSINGEVLTERVKSKIASFKAGRFSPLVCRPYAANTYIMSKICYRAAVFDLRCKDLKSIQSSVKSWISQDLLMKPKETILHRAKQS